MKIEVTDLDTGATTTYTLSRNNWKGAWACMSAGDDRKNSGLVHMWYPSIAREPHEGLQFVTSGRRWRVTK